MAGMALAMGATLTGAHKLLGKNLNLSLQFLEPLFCAPHIHKLQSCIDTVFLLRAGLTIGQTGQMPGASCFWGPRAWIKNTPLLVSTTTYKASVRYNGSTSKTFSVRRGVKQGCVLAPSLFAIYFSALRQFLFFTFLSKMWYIWKYFWLVG